jgi:hypothetical protein
MPDFELIIQKMIYMMCDTDMKIPTLRNDVKDARVGGKYTENDLQDM